jgi:hypothetical protein
MRLSGNHYSAKDDSWGNVTITRRSDLATIYLQGDDATEFIDNHRILNAIEYPSGPFATLAENVDACLDDYAEMFPRNSTIYN